MIEPTLALQKAVRAKLIATSAITNLVPANHIRSGDMRPETLPAILLSDGRVEYLGRASGAQYVARVFLDLHVWAIESGLDTAKTIGAALADALRDRPTPAGFTYQGFDGWHLSRVTWPRDPDPTYGHGVFSVEAVIGWTI